MKKFAKFVKVDNNKISQEDLLIEKALQGKPDGSWWNVSENAVFVPCNHCNKNGCVMCDDYGYVHENYDELYEEEEEFLNEKIFMESAEPCTKGTDYEGIPVDKKCAKTYAFDFAHMKFVDENALLYDINDWSATQVALMAEKFNREGYKKVDWATLSNLT